MACVRRGMVRLVGALVASGLALHVADVSPAHAGSVGKFVNGSTVRFTAATGERNGVSYSAPGQDIFIGDGNLLTVLEGCTQENPYQARCSKAGVTILEILTGNMDDEIYGGGATFLATIDGGSGMDLIEGGAASDFLIGGNGDDVLIGGNGADVLDGGPGFDTVSYSEKISPVLVSLDGIRNDGTAGENDYVTDTVEAVVGGPGSDTITGNQDVNYIDGAGGNDQIAVDGDGAQDIVDGGAGSDDCRGDAADSLTNCEAPFSSSFYGVNGTPGTTGSPQGILEAYERVEEAGLEWVRFFFRWEQIEPLPGDFRFETAQTGPGNWCGCGGCPTIREKIRAARNTTPTRSIIGVLVGTPGWLQGGAQNANPPPAPPPGQEEYFARFAREAAVLFANDVAVWELWNEPNDPMYWTGSAAQYRARILNPGYTAIKTAVPTALVAAPALANPSTSQLNNFLGNSNGMFSSPVDIVSFHLYGSRTDVFNAGNTLDAWCNNQVDCNEWWLTENGFASTGSAGACGNSGVVSATPGDDLVAVFSRCENSFQWFYCGGTFIYNLHDRTNLNGTCQTPTIGCDLGLLTASGAVRNKLCKVENYTTGMYLTPGCP